MSKTILWVALGLIALGLFFWALPTPDTGQPGDPVPGSSAFAIRDARLFDGESVIDRATVIVEADRIAAVGPEVEIAEGIEVIDGAGKTLLPGLIDSHTHVWGQALADAVRFGVTTEIDMFMQQLYAAQMRREQENHTALDRADLVSAGTLVTVPGGHGTQFGLEIPTLAADATGAEAAEFVAERVAEGSDFIKIIYEDGSLFGGDIDDFELTPADGPNR